MEKRAIISICNLVKVLVKVPDLLLYEGDLSRFLCTTNSFPKRYLLYISCANWRKIPKN